MNRLLLENYIKSIIENIEINELHVFDFDMTLYDHSSKSWIQEVITQLRSSIERPEVRVILCTARSKEEKYILKTEELLNDNDMSLADFDDCYFKSSSRKEGAPKYKSYVILDEVYANKKIKKVKFWDDREDTLEQVKIDLKNYNRRISYEAIKP